GRQPRPWLSDESRHAGPEHHADPLDLAPDRAVRLSGRCEGPCPFARPVRFPVQDGMSMMPVSSHPSPRSRTAHFIGYAGLVLLVLLWQLGAQAGLAGSLPGPVTVAVSLWSLLQEKAFLFDLLASGARVASSLGAAMLIGGVLALLPYGAPWLSSLSTTP